MSSMNKVVNQHLLSNSLQMGVSDLFNIIKCFKNECFRLIYYYKMHWLEVKGEKNHVIKEKK